MTAKGRWLRVVFTAAQIHSGEASRFEARVSNRLVGARASITAAVLAKNRPDGSAIEYWVSPDAYALCLGFLGQLSNATECSAPNPVKLTTQTTSRDGLRIISSEPAAVLKTLFLEKFGRAA